MSRIQVNIPANADGDLIINQNKHETLEERFSSNREEFGLSLTDNIIQSKESVHMQAKILNFMKQYAGTIQGAYTINDDKNVLKRVIMLSYPGDITIIHTQEVIDEQLHESYLPETIRDLNLIEANLKRNGNSSD